MVGKADSNGSMSPTTTVWARCFAFLLSSSTRRLACNSVVHEQTKTVKNSVNNTRFFHRLRPSSDTELFMS